MAVNPEKPSGRPRPAWANLHLWQIQWVRDLLVLLGLCGLLLVGERLSLVTVPVLLALGLAYLLEPVIARMTRISWVSRRVASGTIAVATVLFVAVPLLIGVALAALQGIDFAINVASKTTALIASVEDSDSVEKRAELGEGAWAEMRDFLVELRADADAEETTVLGVDRGELRMGFDYVARLIRENADRIGKRALDTSRGALGAAMSTVTSFGNIVFTSFLTLFFFFFTSTGWPRVKTSVLELLPDRQREKSVGILRKMDAAIHGFVRGRLLIAALQAIYYSVGFWLIGVPMPLILGPAVALVTIIPYAGLLMVPVVIVLLWLEGHTGIRGSIWWILLAPFVVYQIAQVLDDYVLTPRIQGKTTDLATPAIVFASIAGGILLGFFGLLVAIPLAACTKILFKELVLPRYAAWTRGQAEDFLPLDRGD